MMVNHIWRWLCHFSTECLRLVPSKGGNYGGYRLTTKILLGNEIIMFLLVVWTECNPLDIIHIFNDFHFWQCAYVLAV